ncbi:MAG TPA: DUF416 family protein [Thermoanaerobaculia bacterium]|nr:DUF416 family protein [Thermoanaerobaculia bacterium]
MKLRYDAERLQIVLESLSPHHRIAFGATCCERLLPNYAAFAKDTGWGDPSVMRDALAYIWMTIGKGTANDAEIARTIANCEALIPDTEEFSSAYTSAAVDAGTAIVETLKALLDPTARHIVDVASFCRDTVHMFIQERDALDFGADSSFDAKIADDPLMRSELGQQAAVLQELKAQPDLNVFFLKRLRTEAQASGFSNIGLPA